jgi:bifunctional enzyme CysN/CysC
LADASTKENKFVSGFDSPYEKPENPELHIDTTSKSVEEAADEIIAYLEVASPLFAGYMKFSN